jgi:hypothetical protein
LGVRSILLQAVALFIVEAYATVIATAAFMASIGFLLLDFDATSALRATREEGSREADSMGQRVVKQ